MIRGEYLLNIPGECLLYGIANFRGEVLQGGRSTIYHRQKRCFYKDGLLTPTRIFVVNLNTNLMYMYEKYT